MLITINHSKKTISFWGYYHVLLPYLLFPMVPTSHSSCQKFHLTPQIISFAAQKKATFQGIPFVWGDMLYPAFMLNPAFIPHQQYFWGWSWCCLFLDSSSLGIRSWSSHVGFMAEFNVGRCLTFETTQMSFISSFTIEMMVKSPFLLINSQAFSAGCFPAEAPDPRAASPNRCPATRLPAPGWVWKIGGCLFSCLTNQNGPNGGYPFWIFWCNCRFYTQVGVVVHWSSFAHWDQMGVWKSCGLYPVFSSTSGKGHQAVARLAMEILFSIQVKFR